MRGLGARPAHNWKTRDYTDPPQPSVSKRRVSTAELRPPSLASAHLAPFSPLGGPGHCPHAPYKQDRPRAAAPQPAAAPHSHIPRGGTTGNRSHQFGKMGGKSIAHQGSCRFIGLSLEGTVPLVRPLRPTAAEQAAGTLGEEPPWFSLHGSLSPVEPRLPQSHRPHGRSLPVLSLLALSG